MDLDIVSSNPFDRVAKIARSIPLELKRPPRIVPFRDVAGAVRATEDLKNRAIFAILFGGGLRVSELVSLRRRHVHDLTNGIGLQVRTMKKKVLEYRPVTLPRWASRYVREYFLEYLCTDLDAWLFPSPFYGGKTHLTRKWVSNLCYKTFGCRAHSARHTHISYLLSKGVPIADVARAVGHSSITSTIVYDQRALDFETCVSAQADFASSKNSIATESKKVYVQ